MKPIFDPEELTLVTEDEAEVLNKYVKLCKEFLDGNGDEKKMKTATSSVSVITKMVQGRSVIAALKFAALESNRHDVTQKMLNNLPESKEITPVKKPVIEKVTVVIPAEEPGIEKKPTPEKKTVEKKAPTEKPVKKKDPTEKSSTTKEILSIQFSKNSTCLLSKGLGIRAASKGFVHVEKTPGQKELRIWFTKKPGGSAFVLNKYGSGLGFIGPAFVKLYSLDGKTIVFETDGRSSMFYGIID